MYLALSVLGYLWLASAANPDPSAAAGPEHWLVVPVQPAASARVPQVYNALEVLGAKTVDAKTRREMDPEPGEKNQEIARADDVRASLLSAKASLRKLQVDEVEKALELAFSQFLRLASPETQSDLLSDVLLMRAELFLATQRRERAITDLQLLARVDVSRQELHPGLHAPALVEAYARARLKNQEAKLGTLVLLPRSVEGTALTIFLDGAEVAAGTGRFATGPHLVTLVVPGAPSRSWVVELEENRPTLLDPFVAPSAAIRKREVLVQKLRTSFSSPGAGPWSPKADTLRELADLSGAQVVVCLSEDDLWVMRTRNGTVQGPLVPADTEPMAWASLALSGYSRAGEVRTAPVKPVGSNVGAMKPDASAETPAQETLDEWVWWTLGTSTIAVALLGSAVLTYAFWPPADIPTPPRPIVVTCCTKGAR